MAWLPVARSVFLRWRVLSVPTTLDGRASRSKPDGVRASPLYRREASVRSAVLTEGGGLLTAGAGEETLAACELEPAEAGALAAPPPPQAAKAARLNTTRRFCIFIRCTAAI